LSRGGAAASTGPPSGTPSWRRRPAFARPRRGAPERLARSGQPAVGGCAV